MRAFLIVAIVAALAGCEVPRAPPLHMGAPFNATPIASEEAIGACKNAIRDSPRPAEAYAAWLSRFPHPPECAGLTSSEYADAFGRQANESMKRVLEDADGRAKIRQARDKIYQAQSEQRRKAAAPLAGNAAEAWGICLRAAARAIALVSAEAAPVVVDAAFGSCDSAEREFVARNTEAHVGLLTEGSSLEIADLVKAKMRPSLIAAAIGARASRTAAGPTEGSQPRPVAKPPRSNDI
jgi:hypothetical protein